MSDQDEERLDLPEEYKKGFNHAELVITQYPHIVDSIHPMDGDSSEYGKGFDDRLQHFIKERDANKMKAYQRHHSGHDSVTKDRDQSQDRDR